MHALCLEKLCPDTRVWKKISPQFIFDNSNSGYRNLVIFRSRCVSLKRLFSLPETPKASVSLARYRMNMQSLIQWTPRLILYLSNSQPRFLSPNPSRSE